MKAIYDWDQWFMLERFTVRRGIEYHCSQSSMVQQIRNASSARDLHVRILDQGDSFLVSVLNPLRKAV